MISFKYEISTKIVLNTTISNTNTEIIMSCTKSSPVRPSQNQSHSRLNNLIKPQISNIKVRQVSEYKRFPKKKKLSSNLFQPENTLATR